MLGLPHHATNSRSFKSIGTGVAQPGAVDQCQRKASTNHFRFQKIPSRPGLAVGNGSFIPQPPIEQAALARIGWAGQLEAERLKHVSAKRKTRDQPVYQLIGPPLVTRIQRGGHLIKSSVECSFGLSQQDPGAGRRRHAWQISPRLATRGTNHWKRGIGGIVFHTTCFFERLLDGPRHRQSPMPVKLIRMRAHANHDDFFARATSQSPRAELYPVHGPLRWITRRASTLEVIADRSRRRRSFETP